MPCSPNRIFCATRHMRPEGGGLEDKAEAAAVGSQGPAGTAGQSAIDIDFAAVRYLQPGYQAQQCGLAGAGRPEYNRRAFRGNSRETRLTAITSPNDLVICFRTIIFPSPLFLRKSPTI